MKEFFIQCLKDLEVISGSRQLYFLESDFEDGERKKDKLIASMVATAARHTEIPQEKQKQIIERMMIEDQDYDMLSARLINKWLSSSVDAHALRSQSYSQSSTTPTYEQYLKNCQANGWDPLPEDQYDKPVTTEQMASFVKTMQENFAKMGPITSPQPRAERYPEKSELPAYLAEHTFNVNGIDIVADNEENAHTIYQLKVMNGEIKPKETIDELAARQAVNQQQSTQ